MPFTVIANALLSLGCCIERYNSGIWIQEKPTGQQRRNIKSIAVEKINRG